MDWLMWTSSLPDLESVSVRRCFKPEGFGNVENTQLHMFSDGSEAGYGACAYLRLVDENGNVTCSLVHGKARLAPLKKMTIPRLELSGAVLACRIFKMLQEELDIQIDQTRFWSDSTIVLGYIKNESKRFKTFVGNRISIMHDLTAPDQWCYVDSASNPADIASRGISASDSYSINTWLNGPEFLCRDASFWPQQKPILRVIDEDEEVKLEVGVHAVTSNILDNLMDYYLDWNTLIKAVCWFTRFQTYCKQRYLKKDVHCPAGRLTLNERRDAIHNVIAYNQHSHFFDEINTLKKGVSVGKSSSLQCLYPVLVDGLVRVKGRHSDPDDNKLLIVLPNKGHITNLIVRHLHDTNGHVGVQQILAYLREKYWVIKGTSSVKSIIKECFLCKRLHGPLCTQQMAPLLEEQMTADKSPFTFVGVDYFGPLLVKSGRSHLKRYGCLFTCLTTRAVHIEVSHSLTTNSFLSAFQRFVSQRGMPEKVYSDNGTNLVSGEKELRQSIKDWNQSEIGQYMVQQEIEWVFNPLYASHRGSAWERLIRSTRSILKATAREQLLSDEQLLTFMTETETIMNDRPITPVSNDPKDPIALTPSMLLLMKSNRSIPMGIFKKVDQYSKR